MLWFLTDIQVLISDTSIVWNIKIDTVSSLFHVFIQNSSSYPVQKSKQAFFSNKISW